VPRHRRDRNYTDIGVQLGARHVHGDVSGGRRLHFVIPKEDFLYLKPPSNGFADSAKRPSET
jgi:hypothetical protein